MNNALTQRNTMFQCIRKKQLRYQQMLRNIIGLSLILFLAGGCEQGIELTDGSRKWRLVSFVISNIDSQESEASLYVSFEAIDHFKLISDALNYSLDTHDLLETLPHIYVVDSQGRKHTATKAGLVVGPLKASGGHDILGESFSFRVPRGSHSFTLHILDLSPVELGK